jgi:ATP-dependent protease ClpP protease subunit
MPHPFKKTRGEFSMKAENKTAEILIYDVIGEDFFYGGIGSKDFVQQLAALGDVNEITVRINSPGGDVFEGVAIYNALKTHPAKINVQIDSLAASIATVIAMAGDTITINDSAMMMVHNASGMCFGEAADMRSMADLLDQIRAGMMLGAYSRTGKSEDELVAIMDAETWYTAQQAVEQGWADSMTPAASKKAAAHAKFDLSAFKHPPLALVEPDTAAADAAAKAEADRVAEEARNASEAAENERISAEITANALKTSEMRDEYLRLVASS